MMKLLKSTKTYTERLNLLDIALFTLNAVAFGVLAGITTSRKKKLQNGLIAGGVFAATCVPIMNKFLDITEEVAEGK